MDTAEFSGCVVIVTGAASGIGRRAAERFLAAGATVIGVDVKLPAPPIERLDYRCADVTEESSWEELITDVLRRYGKLDALVNCAGIILMGAITDMTLADFRRLMAVNVEGTFLGAKHAMRAMLPRGRGSIVNISSTAGIAAAPGASAYCASKGAVRLLTKSAALEAIAAGTAIRVNSVHPGLTETPMVDAIIEQMGGGEEARAQLIAMLPSRQLAKTDDIADAIMFLVSERSRFMNGSELVVDNGLTAQ